MLRRLVVTLAAAAPRARALSHREAWRRATKTDGPKNVTVFYNVFAAAHKRGAEKIVVEQLAQLTNASLWPRVAEIRYATVGNGAIDGFIQKICKKRRLPCVRIGHADAGSELNTLTPLHAFCRENNKRFVAYMHDKGSFHKSQSNTNLRRTLLRALASEGCYDAVTRKNTLGEPCDVCSLRFSPLPHQHVSGNMWLARCSYVERRVEINLNAIEQTQVKRLIAPERFPAKMAEFKREHLGPCRLSGPLFGTERFALEHWVHSHPRCSPCDASASAKFQFGYNRLPPKHEELHVAPAPRFAVGQLKKALLTGTGVDARLRRCPEHAKRTALDSHVDEWLHLYREVPTNASRVMKFYRSLLPRRPGANASQCAAIYDDVSQARGSCRLGSNQWCDFERNRKCVDRSACVWCYDRLGAHPGGVKLVNLTSSHLARKMARRDKRHRRSGRPVVQHDIQKTRFVKNMQRRRPACEATAEGCTPEEMERWAGIS